MYISDDNNFSKVYFYHIQYINSYLTYSTSIYFLVALLWFNIFFTAVCDELLAISNGGISYAQSDLTPEFGVGTVATFSCNEGYQLITHPGDEMRTCVDGGDGNGGKFDGAQPSCERMQSFPVLHLSIKFITLHSESVQIYPLAILCLVSYTFL